MEQQISEKMSEFIDKIDSLCFEYGFEIHPTINKPTNEEATITIIGNGEKVKLVFIDGDGCGK